ncbi:MULTISPECIES: DUF6086 family protein [unclassified Streptomyces]|uniref:DUF6086 family protein n=1 Tax=unclassified Streptomyces TaxID=2593676 RepID=UPI0027E0A4ED|nr:DUF6086 family protein [Streptomyces sp. CB02980]
MVSPGGPLLRRPAVEPGEVPAVDGGLGGLRDEFFEGECHPFIISRHPARDGAIGPAAAWPHGRRTSHTIWLALSEGFTATVLVLAERAVIKVDWARQGAAPEAPLEDVQVSTVTGMSTPAEGAAWAAGLREKAQELGRRMPR